MRQKNTPVEQSDGRDRLTDPEKIAAVAMVHTAVSRIVSGKLELSRTDAIGAGDSAHDVFFAKVADRRLKNIPGVAEVAIKRFRRRDSAEKELNNLRAIGELGFLTLSPIGEGVFSLGALGYGLVTERIPGLKTMNQIDWRKYSPSDEGYVSIRGLLGDISRYVGLMHGHGVIHNDLRVKNVGRAIHLILGNTSFLNCNGFVAFDAEGSHISTKADDPTFEGNCFDDISKFVVSLAEKGFLKNVSPSVLREEVEEGILVPYLDNGGNETVVDSFDRLIENIEVERHRQVYQR